MKPVNNKYNVEKKHSIIKFDTTTNREENTHPTEYSEDKDIDEQKTSKLNNRKNISSYTNKPKEKNIKSIDNKQYVLSKLKLFNNVGFYKQETDMIGNGKVIIKSYSIESLNNHKLLYPWHILYDFSKFNVKEVNNEYGKYLLIRGKFSYRLAFNGYGGRVTGGFFDIGFANSSKCIIFRKGEFNEKLFKKKNKDIIFSQDIDDCKYIMTGNPYSIF